jgi:ribonucleoside-diphosphate reductase subunit M1
MRVLKRNGEYEDVSFDKISNRLKSLCIDPNLKLLDVDTSLVAQKVCAEIYDGVTTKELDILSSEISISLYSTDINYKNLASRIIISNHHKNTDNKFSDVVKKLYNYKDVNKNNIPLINNYLHNLVLENEDLINSKIDYTRDYLFDFFGFKTLEKSYLLKVNGIIVERPQHLLMRTSLAIHRNNLDKAFETYDYMSKHYFIHATPTLFNAGTNREQFSSCFLLSMEDDSVDGIFNTLKDCAKISKYAGGIGLSIHNIRAKNSFIAGTNGVSNGIVPMLRVFNDTARYIDQGGGKRNGSFAIYLEPWHSDIFEFIELKKNHGNELERARDLFYGLWIPDLFMERVKDDKMWSLFCPHKCPGLEDVHSDNFKSLYEKYESDKLYDKQVKAQELWFAILTSQIETGVPYLVYKDACNNKSNQKNLGTIHSSNLCTEIVEYSNAEQTAVCNLASISLRNCLSYKNTSDLFTKIYYKPDCIYCKMAENLCKNKKINYEMISYENFSLIEEKQTITFPKIFVNNEFIGGFVEFEKYLCPDFDYNLLKNISKILTRNLNNIIDYNYYPTEKTKKSNFLHRPIGIGVQGLANVFYELKISFDSEEAAEINKKIFETIYYGSLESSMEIAKERESYIIELQKLNNRLDNIENSDFVDMTIRETEGQIKEIKDKILVIPEELDRKEYLGTYSSYIDSPIYNGELQFDMWNHKVDNSLWDWDKLRSGIKQYGIRNSLLVAPMPTASTSQILGNYECFEPVISNIYTRRVLAGEYTVLNDYMVKDIKLLDKWNVEMKEKIIVNDGSIQNISEIPEFIRNRYKTAWELKQKDVINMAVDRGKFICQSQSLNLFIESPSFKKLTSMHFYGWSNGLKTGIYYLRSRPSSKAIQFTISPEICENCSA